MTPSLSPDFSIVILTCNQRELTLRCLRSLEPYLDAHADTEVILVDNGSTDGTLEALKAFGERYGERFTAVRNDDNRGVAAGRNIGLGHASGSVLMLLDNDTIATPDALGKLRTYVAAKRSCGIAAPRLVAPDGTVQPSAKPFPGIGIKVAHTLRPGSETSAERRAMTAAHPFYVIGACQVFRADTFRLVGALDDNIFYGPEDADFCMRVRAAGLTIDYLPDVQIVHDWQRATRRNPLSRLGRRHARALAYFYRKHRRLW